jgi:hypothetical protein
MKPQEIKAGEMVILGKPFCEDESFLFPHGEYPIRNGYNDMLIVICFNPDHVISVPPRTETGYRKDGNSSA